MGERKARDKAPMEEFVVVMKRNKSKLCNSIKSCECKAECEREDQAAAGISAALSSPLRDLSLKAGEKINMSQHVCTTVLLCIDMQRTLST